jgi:hypothetical protein
MFQSRPLFSSLFGAFLSLVAFISKRLAFSISFWSFSSFKPSHSNTASRCGLPTSGYRAFLQMSSRGASDQASSLVDYDGQIIVTSFYSQSNACHLCPYYYCINPPHVRKEAGGQDLFYPLYHRFRFDRCWSDRERLDLGGAMNTESPPVIHRLITGH